MSFIRLSERRNVDLPQPDGPMSAVTSFGRILHGDLLEHAARRRSRSPARRRRSWPGFRRGSGRCGGGRAAVCGRGGAVIVDITASTIANEAGPNISCGVKLTSGTR